MNAHDGEFMETLELKKKKENKYSRNKSERRREMKINLPGDDDRGVKADRRA